MGDGSTPGPVLAEVATSCEACPRDRAGSSISSCQVVATDTPGVVRRRRRGASIVRIDTGGASFPTRAGGGSIADWMCERVGPHGHVVATDIDPRFLGGLQRSNLEVRRHDVASDPLPEGEFDLVHARLVLVHLPQRERALERMVRALKPGGWLVAEEFDSLSMRPDSAINPDEVLLETFDALQRVMTARGVDLRYGRLLPGRFLSHGLADVGAEGRTFLWRGGGPGAAPMRANFDQLRDALVDSGLVGEHAFAADLGLLDDASFNTPSPIMWAVWGRRP